MQRPSVRRNVYRSTDPPSMKNSSFRYSSLTVFRALFAKPRSSLDTTFGTIIVKGKLMELLMLSRFSPVGRRSSGREHSNPSTDGPSAPSFYLQDARYPSAQFWRCAPEEDVQAQKIKAEMLGKDVEGVVHHQEHFGIEKTRGLVARKER